MVNCLRDFQFFNRVRVVMLWRLYLNLASQPAANQPTNQPAARTPISLLLDGAHKFDARGPSGHFFFEADEMLHDAIILFSKELIVFSSCSSSMRQSSILLMTSAPLAPSVLAPPVPTHVSKKSAKTKHCVSTAFRQR